MEKRWAQVAKGSTEKIDLLAQQLNIDRSLVDILVQRGISDFEEARNFFRPEMARLNDPYLMKDMDLAVERIDLALAQNEKILIYGDYDVDGTTSVALVYSFFSQFTDQLEFYIPDRHKEGYGISTIGIDYAQSNGFKLIIALDCGIKSVDKVSYAKSLGIDFIICDHHLPGDELPDAVAVLDPKREDCSYPFKELAGCGIGFKLAQAYCQKHGLPADRYERYLDLVMVSIAADIVPVVGENRILAHHGLIKLNTNPCIGLRSLLESSGSLSNVTLSDVVFRLAPRINAAGRMHHGNEAVKMLLCKDEQTAKDQGTAINTFNSDRKTSDQLITAEAIALIDESGISNSKKTTVVYNENWNKGVIGIVASRLIEKYYRPTIVLTLSNGFLTGSARSVAGFDLYEALSACSDLLEQYGGHKFAAGLTLKSENLAEFSERFEKIVGDTITDDMCCPEIQIDSEICFNQITGKFQRILTQMGPFGPQNPSPVFVTKNVKFKGLATVVGEKHLRLNLYQPDSTVFESIGFGMGEYASILQLNKPFSVCYTIEENWWKEQKRLQLNLKGIKIED